MVGTEAAVAAAHSLDSGEIWHPCQCQAPFHAPTQAPEAVSPERHHPEAQSMLLQPCLSDCDGHLQNAQ